MALLLILGATGYAWLINTQSYSRLNYPNPGAGEGKALIPAESGYVPFMESVSRFVTIIGNL